MKKRAKGSPEDGSGLQPVPDRKDVEGDMERKPKERALLHTFEGDCIDITDEIKEMIEETKMKKERTLFRRIKNKLSKMANAAKKKLKPEERIIVVDFLGNKIDVTEEIRELILEPEEKESSKKPKDGQQE